MTTTHNPDNAKAVISMILGLVSLTGFGFLLGIPAIILGIIALKKNEGEKAFSITGIISGTVSTLFSIAALMLLVVLLLIGFTFSNSSLNVIPGESTGDSTMHQHQPERT